MATKKFKYESDLDTNPDDATSIVSVVRCNFLTAGLTIAGGSNDVPEADQNSNLPIRVAGTKKYGITARHIVISRLTGSTTTPNTQLVKVVIFQPSFFVTIISSFNPSIAFNGLEDWKLIGAQNERFHLLFDPS